MSKEKPKEPENQELKFSQQEYDLLKSCSDKKDVTEWNEWREKNPKEAIWLQGADFCNSYLEGARLEHAHLEGANLAGANLQDCTLILAHIEGANLGKVHLERANLACAKLQGAFLFEANLVGANFDMANLQSANLQGANLEGAFIPLANLKGADLIRANLQDAQLVGANLQGAILREANLEGANFETAVVDGETLIWNCKVNRYSKNKHFTNFEGVGLGSVRINPGTKQLLEYNIRRKSWEEWYKGKSKNKCATKMRWFATIPIRWFWSISDYGRSTGQIILWFFMLAISFATIYFVWGAIDYYLREVTNEPGIVKKLFIGIQTKGAMSEVYYSLMIYFRAVYFSVVTMTTLGFGDMYANETRWGCEWWFGHLLLILQVIMGYVLLGALVTRFSILFKAGGPAGTFAKVNKEKVR
ncbi:hypothetical protein ES707_22324 [subsurface metagenome]